MKKSTLMESSKLGGRGKAAMATAATLLGISLGANVENVYALTTGLGGFVLSADQFKIGGAVQLKMEDVKIDLSQLKLDTNQLKDLFVSGQYKFNVADIDFLAGLGGSFQYLYHFPDNISPENPFLIPIGDIPIGADGQPLFNFLTFGVKSIAYNVTADYLEITSVVPSSVPEPASLLLVGAGLAGLMIGRKRLRKA